MAIVPKDPNSGKHIVLFENTAAIGNNAEIVAEEGRGGLRIQLRSVTKRGWTFETYLAAEGGTTFFFSRGNYEMVERLTYLPE